MSCVNVERRMEQHRIPKGQGLTQHAMEHFYRWGVADKVRSARVLPRGFSLRGVTAYLNLSSEYWYSPPFREVVNTYYFQDSERLPQYLTESVLRTRMAELPSVQSLVGWTAEQLSRMIWASARHRIATGAQIIEAVMRSAAMAATRPCVPSRHRA
jgi:hypothetical protein